MKIFFILVVSLFIISFSVIPPMRGEEVKNPQIVSRKAGNKVAAKQIANGSKEAAKGVANESKAVARETANESKAIARNVTQRSNIKNNDVRRTQGKHIPEEHFRANFGKQHTFYVNQRMYESRRFQYGGFWFGFIDPWPSFWLYSDPVYVDFIDDGYFLCNPYHTGVCINVVVQ